jgi:hypothetical protein
MTTVEPRIDALECAIVELAGHVQDIAEMVTRLAIKTRTPRPPQVVVLVVVVGGGGWSTVTPPPPPTDRVG